MLLTIKTLQQLSFTVEIQESCSVRDLKDKIHTLQGYSVDSQKLIHSGKILQDTAVLSDCNIQEKDFLVVMVTKPKAPVVAPAPVVPAPVAVQAPAPAPAIVPAAPAPVSSVEQTGLATGSAYEDAVNNLVEMGFEKPLVVRAMRAAFNNPDRAAEYLMTGIPESLQRDLAPPAASPAPSTVTPTGPAGTPAPSPAVPAQGQPFNMFEAAAAQARGANTPASAAPAGNAASQLGMLRNSAQFQQLRQLVQAQPELLQPLLQQLGQSSPEMLQMINANPEEFMSLFAEPGAEGEFEEEGSFVTISPEDDAAINRLTALGFERNQAAEAFLACDKNEELAANYLFDQMGNDNW